MNLVSPARFNELCFPQDPVPLPKLWRWCRNGALPAQKIGGEWYIDVDAFQQKDEPKQHLVPVMNLVVDRLRRL